MPWTARGEVRSSNEVPMFGTPRNGPPTPRHVCMILHLLDFQVTCHIVLFFVYYAYTSRSYICIVFHVAYFMSLIFCPRLTFCCTWGSLETHTPSLAGMFKAGGVHTLTICAADNRHVFLATGDCHQPFSREATICQKDPCESS